MQEEKKTKENVLPVLQEAVSLRQLRALIDEMAAEQEVVLRRHGQRVAHENGAVDNECRRHAARYAVYIHM